VRKQSTYKDFQDQIFREIVELESESKKNIISKTCREFGLTLNEAARLYYKPGMSGQQFLDAVRSGQRPIEL